MIRQNQRTDSLTINEDEPVLITAAELLANDVERDGDPLTITSVRAGFGGSATLNANDTILFTPGANYNGQAHFFYTVDDGQGGQVEARVDVQVDPVNDAPFARDESYSENDVFYLNGTEDVPLSISIADLISNDSDVDSPALSITSVSFADNGTASLQDDGTILFTPDADYWGEASFSYVVADADGLVDDATVTMYFDPVGDAPPVAQDDAVSIYEDVETTFLKEALLGNDTDIDRDVLEISSVVMAPGSKGSVRVDIDGNVVFTPELNHNGTSWFYYTVTDNADGEDVGLATVTIIAVNDAPTAAPDTGTTSLDAPLILRIADLLANDSDVDLDPVDYDLLSFVGVHSASTGTTSIYNDEFVVVEFDPGFSGNLSLQYTIEDDQNVVDDGTVLAVVSSTHASTLTGSSIRDLIIGTELGETINGLDGDDDLFGRGGDDQFNGGDGADRIDGGDGYDTVSFAGSNIGVHADLGSRIGQGGFSQGDTYISIESLSGTQFADELAGDAGDNLLAGLAGNDNLIGRDGVDILDAGDGDDRLEGGKGADDLRGGDGSDTADYFFSDAAVQVSLEAATATGGDAEGDQLSSIENIRGSDFDDNLEGDSNSNLLDGGRGDDLLIGGAGDDILIGGRGADQLIGGEGRDRADYSQSATAVSINMTNGAAGGGDAEGDTFSSVELVVGSFHDDIIIGDASDNIIMGGRGADQIEDDARLNLRPIELKDSPRCHRSHISDFCLSV